jgi:hypothetical protein
VVAQGPQGPGAKGQQARRRSAWQVRSDDVSMAVVVNGLVNSLTVIKAAARLLDTYWAQLPEHDRTSMLADITRHADFIAGVLADVAQDLPPLPADADVIDLRLDVEDETP